MARANALKGTHRPREMLRSAQHDSGCGFLQPYPKWVQGCALPVPCLEGEVVGEGRAERLELIVVHVLPRHAPERLDDRFERHSDRA